MNLHQIQDKARQIIADKEAALEHELTCVKARICPACGEDLKLVGCGSEFNRYECMSCPPIKTKSFLWFKIDVRKTYYV